MKQAVDAALEVESVAAWLQQQGRTSISWKLGLACARLVGLELTGVAELERLGKHVAREAALITQKLQQLEVKRRHQANKIGKRKAGAESEASLERLLASHRDACAQLRAKCVTHHGFRDKAIDPIAVKHENQGALWLHFACFHGGTVRACFTDWLLVLFTCYCCWCTICGSAHTPPKN